jgi:dCMP deaminase
MGDYKRPDWDSYFLELCEAIAKRATCDRGRAGAVIVRNKQIVSTGYVGAPKGLKHCDEIGHELHAVENEDGTRSQHCIRTTHAEQNAIIQAASNGVSTQDTTLYCRLEPCYTCAKMIINAGIKRVVCEKRYHRGQRTREIFKEAGLELIVMREEIENYPDQ